MSIKYKYVNYDNPLSQEKSENKVRPQVVSIDNADTREVIEQIVQNNYYSRPDATKAVEAVFQSIEQLLKMGRSVTIDSYGTFMLTAQFSKDKVANNDPSLKDKSSSLRSESVEVKNVVFRATQPMKRRIGVGNFERVKE